MLNLQSFKSKFTLSLIFALSFCYSCKKADTFSSYISNETDYTQKFFATAGSESAIILKVNQQLKNENSKTEFVSKLVNIAGFPRWDKTIIYSNQSNISNNYIAANLQSTDADTICLIPIVSTDNTFITGVIIATIGDLTDMMLNY